MHHTAHGKEVALEKLLIRLWVRKEVKEIMSPCNLLNQAQPTFLPPGIMVD